MSKGIENLTDELEKELNKFINKFLKKDFSKDGKNAAEVIFMLESNYIASLFCILEGAKKNNKEGMLLCADLCTQMLKDLNIKLKAIGY